MADPIVDPAGTPELTIAIRRLCRSAIDVRLANYRMGAALDGRAARDEAEARIAQVGWRAVAGTLRSLALQADQLAGDPVDPPRLRRIGPGDG